MTTTSSTHTPLELALHKINSVDVPQGNAIAIAYSGGLDSTLCVKLSEEKYHAKSITAISVDVGQGEQEIQEGIQRAEKLGITPIILNAKQEFTQHWLTKAIQANSDYNGYPVSTSMTRQLIASKIATKALELGCNALMEGSTGKGNDQYRMHNVFSLFAPGVSVFVPVRDFDLTRGEEQLLMEHYGIPVEELIAGGDDKTMWCRSYRQWWYWPRYRATRLNLDVVGTTRQSTEYTHNDQAHMAKWSSRCIKWARVTA